MKNELINNIQPNCLLAFGYMILWLDNISLPNDVDGSLRQVIKSYLRSNGRLDVEGWNLLLENAEFEANSPITKEVALQWIEQYCSPTCAQLKVLINALKITGLAYLMKTTDVLDMLELDYKIIAGTEPSDYTKNIYYSEGTPPNQHEVLVVARIPEFNLKGFELIQDAKPYYVFERLAPQKNRNYGGKKVKGGWKRDRDMMILNGYFHCNGVNYLITENNGYRPNEIPITSGRHLIDFRPENYFALTTNGGNNKIPHRVGLKNENNDLWAQTQGAKTETEKIPMRVRVAFKIGNIEKISKPLKYFSIFAKVTTPQALGINSVAEKAVLISLTK